MYNVYVYVCVCVCVWPTAHRYIQMNFNIHVLAGIQIYKQQASVWNYSLYSFTIIDKSWECVSIAKAS